MREQRGEKIYFALQQLTLQGQLVDYKILLTKKGLKISLQNIEKQTNIESSGKTRHNETTLSYQNNW